MAIANYIYNDFRRLFEQEDARFDADEFIEYAKNHDYSTDYESLKVGFVSMKLAEE